MFNLGMPELILILIIALVVFGPGKLPEVGKAVGRGIQEFRRATSGELNGEPKAEPQTGEKTQVVANDKK